MAVAPTPQSKLLSMLLRSFQGQGLESTVISWHDTASSSHGTSKSASYPVVERNRPQCPRGVKCGNLPRQHNPYHRGCSPSARCRGGPPSFSWSSRKRTNETTHTVHDDKGRHYFRDCYIQGSIDFIYGDGRSFYENCQLISIASSEQNEVNGVLTTQARISKYDNTGYVFYNCSIGGTGRVWLGRACRPFSRVIFAYTNMSDIISPEGWNDFGDPTRDQSVFYGEYMCSGPGANLTGRVPYEHMLNDTEAAPFLNLSFIDADQWLQPYDSQLILQNPLFSSS